MQVPFQHIRRKKHIPKSFTKANDGKHAYVSLWMDYHFTSRSNGDLDLQGFLGMSENIRNGYEKIDVSFRIKADAPEEKLKELVELAQKRSPVFDMISNPTPVNVHLETN